MKRSLFPIIISNERREKWRENDGKSGRFFSIFSLACSCFDVDTVVYCRRHSCLQVASGIKEGVAKIPELLQSVPAIDNGPPASRRDGVLLSQESAHINQEGNGDGLSKVIDIVGSCPCGNDAGIASRIKQCAAVFAIERFDTLGEGAPRHGKGKSIFF